MTDDKGEEKETSIIDGEFTEAGGKGGGDETPAATTGGQGHRILHWLSAFVILCLAGFIGGLFAAPYVERQMIAWGLISSEFAGTQSDAQSANDSASSTRLDDLEITLTTALGRIDALESRITRFIEDEDTAADRLARLEDHIATLGAGPDGDIDLTALFAQIDRLDRRIGAMEGQIRDISGRAAGDSAAGQNEALQTVLSAVDAARDDRRQLAEQLQSLSQRTAALESIDRTGSLRGPQLATDLILLRRSIESGTPFSASLDAVRASLSHFPGSIQNDAQPMLDRLSEYAGAGVPSSGALRRAFEALAPAIKRSAQVASGGDEDQGWLSKLGESLSSIVTVRSINPADAAGIDAIILMAGAALEDGDAERAYRLIDNLDRRAKQPAQQWLTALRNRVEVDSAYKSLMERLGARGEL